MTEHTKNLKTRREKIRELLAAGVKVADIVRRLGCGRSTVQEVREREGEKNYPHGNGPGSCTHELKTRLCERCRNPIYTAECLICKVRREKTAAKDAEGFREWWERVRCEVCGEKRGDIVVGGKRFCVGCFDRARKAKAA